MQRPCAPKARRPTFGPLCIRPTILPFLCSCPFLVSIFTVGLCVLWVLCGPSKATARCYTSICDGIIYLEINAINSKWILFINAFFCPLTFFTASKRLCLFVGCFFFAPGSLWKTSSPSSVTTICFLSVDFFLDPWGAPLGAAGPSTNVVSSPCLAGHLDYHALQIFKKIQKKW